jgi:alkanesulfonate monooxygenase SsuD/methylene tetrahydromethanopterin reductase-like flavin-dependent oxidoreductase (luciferase family)
VQETIPQLDHGSEFSYNKIIAKTSMLTTDRDPKDASRNSKDRMDYYLWLARTAEKGKISSIFFADVYAGHEVYGGSMEATYAGGSQVGVLDPVVMIGPMAAVTQSVGLVVTGSSSYISAWFDWLSPESYL